MSELESNLQLVEMPDGGLIGYTPTLWVETPQGEVEMDYINTRLNSYPGGKCDHVEHTDEDGNVSRFLLDQIEEIDLAALRDKDYPRFYNPLIPEEVSEWYYGIELHRLGIPPTSETESHEEMQEEEQLSGASRIQTLGGSALGFAYNRAARIFNAGYRELVKQL